MHSINPPPRPQMFLFTHLDHDVELMIVAEVEELTKFRACTRQFKRMIKDYSKVLKHEHIARPLYSRLDDSNVYLRMVTMGIVNASHDVCGIHSNGRHHNIRARDINRWQDGMHFVVNFGGGPSDGYGHGNSTSRWVDMRGEYLTTRKPYVEQMEFQREQKRDLWGVVIANPHLQTHTVPDDAWFHEHPSRPGYRRLDHIPAHIKGLKLEHPLSWKTCAQIDILLRDMGAVRYKSKRKAEKLALWWKLKMAQSD